MYLLLILAKVDQFQVKLQYLFYIKPKAIKWPEMSAVHTGLREEKEIIVF